MPFPDTSYNLRIELDTHNCELTAEQIEELSQRLEPLRKPVEKFPVSDLYITVTFQPRSHKYRLKTALVLTGRTLAAGELDEHVLPAFDRCIRKLVYKVQAYREDLERTEEQAKLQKGTHQQLLPTQDPDPDTLRRAVDEEDYATFRTETYVYEEALRKRIGRWIERYPDVEAQLGETFTIADFVEEVFLNAFERYDRWPKEVRFGEWLEHLIDPSIKLLTQHRDEELENIDFARSLQQP